MLGAVSNRVRVGLRLDPLLPKTPDAGAELERLAVLAIEAESRAFDVIWVAERWTSESALIPSALVFCAAVAVRTRSVRIATGLLPLPFHHPLRVAEDGASVDGLSGGRFELGVGLGSDPDALARFGVGTDLRVERFEEALDLIQQAWRGEPLDASGPHFPVSGITVHPLPTQPGGPPIWVGAAAPAAQRRAAARGCGLVLRVGDSPGPFLEAWQECHPGRQPRLALLLGAGDPAPQVAMPALDGVRRSGAAIDWILPWGGSAGGPGLDEATGHAEQLRRETGR